MAIKRKRRQGAPLPSMVGHSASSAFREEHVGAVLAAVGSKPKKSKIWLSEALNDALTDYLASFAISRAGPPSAQASWTTDLRTAADNCLEMLAPGFDMRYPPRRVASEAYSALFHNGPPPGISSSQLKFLGHNSEWEALDKIADSLWLLRTFANHARQEWAKRTVPRGKRRKTRSAILNWVSNLGCRYAEAFGKLPPTRPDDNAPFVRFCEAIRSHAVQLRDAVTDSGTDTEAYRELDGFSAKPLVAFVRRHSDILATRWRAALKSAYTPEQISLGIISETTGTENTGG